MIIFLCGIPAAGKTNFSKFLEEKHNFYHIDMEHSPWKDESFHRVWDLIFFYPTEDKRVEDFITILNEKYSNSVLDLGFQVAPSYFRIIKLLRKFGCKIVWLDCDVKVARQRYIKRDPLMPVSDFDRQVKDIKDNWQIIVKEINPIIIDVLTEGTNNKSFEELYAEITK